MEPVRWIDVLVGVIVTSSFDDVDFPNEDVTVTPTTTSIHPTGSTGNYLPPSSLPNSKDFEETFSMFQTDSR